LANTFETTSNYFKSTWMPTDLQGEGVYKICWLFMRSYFLGPNGFKLIFYAITCYWHLFEIYFLQFECLSVPRAWNVYAKLWLLPFSRPLEVASDLNICEELNCEQLRFRLLFLNSGVSTANISFAVILDLWLGKLLRCYYSDFIIFCFDFFTFFNFLNRSSE